MEPPTPGDRAAGAASMLTHDRVLGSRIHLQSRVRIVAAIVMIAGTLFARFVLRIDGLDVTGLFVLAFVIAGYSTVTYLLTRRYRGPAWPGGTATHLRVTLHAAIVLDFLGLTVAVWLVGGVRSPFTAFYLLHVILSCLLLTRREAVMVAAMGYALIVGLVIGEWSGFLRPRLPLGAVSGAEPLDGRFAVTVLAVYALLIAVTVFLVTTLADRLRAGEENLRSENVELGRRSSLRRDFLHMALHDVQAPVGVVTTNLRNMAAGIGGTLSERHAASVDRSLRRLGEINQFLEEFRKLEALESEPIAEQLEAVNVEAMLEGLAETHREQAESRGHTIVVDVTPALPAVRAIPGLLREAVANYLTNAIKYTPDGGRIVLRAYRRARNVCVEVEDNGIGIAPDDQKKLFREFVRIDHSGTPVAGERGTGLGLSIVRRIIERQGGVTGVRSRPGVGSTFMLQLTADDHVAATPSAPDPEAS